MKRWMLLLLFAVLAASLFAEEELPLNQFMERVRFPNPTATYAALDGQIQHRRSGESPKSESIYFAVILQPERMTGQIIIGGREGYLIGQTRNSGSSETSVVPMQGSQQENPMLGYMGVRASDLTMSFLFYPVVKELDADSVTVTSPVGKVTLRIIDREEPKCIKFEAEGSPLPFNVWIQLLPVGDDSCKMRVTLRAEVNVFMKAMVSKPLQQAVDGLADLLGNIPYGA